MEHYGLIDLTSDSSDHSPTSPSNHPPSPSPSLHEPRRSPVADAPASPKTEHPDDDEDVVMEDAAEAPPIPAFSKKRKVIDDNDAVGAASPADAVADPVPAAAAVVDSQASFKRQVARKTCVPFKLIKLRHSPSATPPSDDNLASANSSALMASNTTDDAAPPAAPRFHDPVPDIDRSLPTLWQLCVKWGLVRSDADIDTSPFRFDPEVEAECYIVYWTHKIDVSAQFDIALVEAMVKENPETTRVLQFPTRKDFSSTIYQQICETIEGLEPRCNLFRHHPFLVSNNLQMVHIACRNSSPDWNAGFVFSGPFALKRNVRLVVENSKLAPKLDTIVIELFSIVYVLQQLFRHNLCDILVLVTCEEVPDLFKTAQKANLEQLKKTFFKSLQDKAMFELSSVLHHQNFRVSVCTTSKKIHAYAVANALCISPVHATLPIDW